MPLSSHSVDAPDVGHVEVPAGYVDVDDYIERCCHILKQPEGSTSTAAPPWTLCGLSLRRPAHQLRNTPVCGECGRPRCPDCHARYGRGER